MLLQMERFLFFMSEYIYPKGTPIPVKLRNGTIDYSGKYDPTSREKDRILPEGSARTVEELASLVLYRDGEAVS